MLYYIISYFVIAISRLFPKRGQEYNSNMSDGDLARNINSLAHNMRMPKRDGNGVPFAQIKMRLKRAYKVICHKEKQKKEIFGYEKWLKENYYIFLKYMGKTTFSSFNKMPHKHGYPRIISLANFIVKFSSGGLNRERIEKIVRSFNSVTPLYFSEICMMKEALAYCLLQEIALLAEKSIYYDMMNAKAQSKTFSAKHCHSDSYIYYYIKAHGSLPKSEQRMQGEINPQSSSIGFLNLLADNELLVASYTNSLRNLHLILSVDSEIAMSVLDEIYKKDASYRDMSEIAKRNYLTATDKLSTKYDVSEITVASGAIFISRKYGIHFGNLLYKQKHALKAYIKSGKILPLKDRGTSGQCLYSLAVVVTSLVFAASPLLFARNILTYISVPLLFIALLSPVEYIIKRLLQSKNADKPLLVMGYKEVPVEATTAVIVSRFIGSAEDVDKAICHIEGLSYNCVDDNVHYVLLVDFPSRDTEWTSEDDTLLDIIKNKVRELNESIHVYVRGRQKIGGRYSGYERKRGAILQLFQAINGESEQLFVYISHALPPCRLAVLLDDDSALMPGSIMSAINSMCHPLNQDYELMSFGGKINRYSITTFYSDKYSRSCGVDCYPCYSDFYSDNFGAALYCGKAIVRISAYMAKLSEFFPDRRILSHDIIEGAVLSSVSLKQCVYEDAPDSFVSDESRSSRWQRGDVQLLPYTLSRIRNKKGEKVANPIAPIYKLILFINGMSVCREFALMTVLVLGLLYRMPILIMVAATAATISYAYSVLLSLRLIFTNTRAVHALRVIIHSVFLLSDYIIMLPFRAVRGVYIFTVTMCKMIIHSKSLMDWKPFSTVQGSSNLSQNFGLVLPAVLVNTALLLLVHNVWFTLYIAFFILYSCTLALMSRPLPKQKLKAHQKELLDEWGKQTFRYFEDMMKDNALIPDNLQLYPYLIKSVMTSPTNIGFSMLAYVVAAKLKYVDEQNAIDTLSKQLDEIECLPKWRGHLYNWYKVSDGSVMPPGVISTVDSANFLCCLIVCKQFFKEIMRTDLANRCAKIIEETDFSALYNAQTKLLCIVYNQADKCFYGQYDLLASEARLAYILAIAQGVNIDSYFNLGRECNALYGNTLMSWSGTAFEYMLPRIFTVPPKGSLLAIQENNSAIVQSKHKICGVFGKSECGYNCYNSEMNYCYQAVGVEELAFSGGVSKPVISPYSSMIYLPYIADSAISNLERLIGKRMYDKYGFFEAIDFSENEEIVKSYMSHHQGMSLAAIANALSDDLISKMFMAEPLIKSATLLLAEEPIVTKQLRNRKQSYSGKFVSTDSLELCVDSDPAEVFVSDTDKYSLVIDKYGRGYSRYKGRLINTFEADSETPRGIFVMVEEGSEKKSPTYYPYCDSRVRAVFEREKAMFYNDKEGIVMTVKPLQCFGGELRRVDIVNNSAEVRRCTVNCYADICLNDYSAYVSHPAFSDMFINSEIDQDRNSIYYHRTELDCGVSQYFGVMVKGLKNCKYNSNRYNVPGRLSSLANVDFSDNINSKDAPTYGNVLYPCIAISGEIEVEPWSSDSVYVVMLAGDEKHSLVSALDKVDMAYKSGAIELLGMVDNSRALPELNLQDTAKLGGALLYQNYPQRISKYINENSMVDKLANFGIDSTLKIVFYDLTAGWEKEGVRKVINGCKMLNNAGITHQLIISCSEVAGVNKNNRELIEELVYGIVKDKKYFTVLSEKQAEQWDIKKIAFICVNDIKNMTRYPHTEISVRVPQERLQPMQVCFNSGEGGFTADGYQVQPLWKSTLLPYSNVVGWLKGGFVVTENGGGFTFGENSREDKLTVWAGDAVSDTVSEQILLELSGTLYRINTAVGGGICTHKKGMTTFANTVQGVRTLCSVYSVNNGAYKVYEIAISNQNSEKIKGKLAFKINPALGWKKSDNIYVEVMADCARLTNVINKLSMVISSVENIDFCASKEEFARLFCNKADSAQVHTEKVKQDFADCYCAYLEYEVPPQRSCIKYFIMGAGDVKLNIKDAEELRKKKAETFAYFGHTSRVTIDSGDLATDILLNHCLPYQALSSRINSRTGYYQCSGAIGFRDQLQDMLSLLLSNPSRVREHIVNCAAHQYAEGDVQHWWHPPRIGVRTRVTDDRLWLPYIVARYVEVTGDYSLLTEEVPFLISEPLNPEENSRYEYPMVSEDKMTLKEHILRAIKCSINYGEHGLLLIGGGDWNDGLDAVGRKGRGESVWLSMFAVTVIKDCINYFDTDLRAELTAVQKKLCACINNVFRDGRFPMCFADDGEWLGYQSSKCCTLSLNSQSFAVISSAVDKQLAERAMITAEELIDNNAGIIKLLSPPFGTEDKYGYISAYPKGMRENGGQYTHGAVWYYRALLLQHKGDKAYEVLKMLNPLEKCRNEKGTVRYKLEPYVLAGDVYGVSPYSGRGGWSWYTGSAGWLYYTMIEDMIGLKVRGEKLYIQPCLPKGKKIVKVQYIGDNAIFKIELISSDKSEIHVNGDKIEQNYISINECKGEVNVTVYYE